MINQRAWPARAMYLLIATALAISLIITAAPAQKVSADPGLSEWTRADTPTTDGWVLAPCSEIVDYALDANGEVAYAVVEQYEFPCPDPCDGESNGDGSVHDPGYYLLKSEDHAATWDDITDKLEALLDTDAGDSIIELVQVATDWEDPDFVAVALWWWDQSATDDYLNVFFSTDGGDTFMDAGEVEDGGVYFDIPYAVSVSDLAVSYESDGKRDIAIGGIDDGGEAALFRCTVTGDAAGSWEDTTDTTKGWDDEGDFTSIWVTDIIFSPSWTTDKTILVTTINPTLTGPGPLDVRLQSGSWGISPGWNEKSTLGIEAVLIKEGESLPTWLASFDARAIAGITLPEDYDGKDTDKRLLWVWVNYDDPSTWEARCDIMRVDNDSAGLVGPLGQIEEGEVWLTNISYHGTIAEGEAIAGVLGDGVGGYADCCEGVQVYRNDGIANMDICCIRWEDACKPPTGVAGMAVSYVGDDKAYAVALQGECLDESAWSVTFDDGDTWNQLSLIDTYIDNFADVAVSPDCNKAMAVSINDDWGCGCDSVWLHAQTLPEAGEYSGKWIRTWCGELHEDENWGLLRLAPEETTGDTVVLVDYYTSNVYWNGLEGLACWDPIGSTVLDHIVDVALEDTDTLFALDENGDVAMFDDDEWHEEVASEVDNGWTIAVWGDWILVGGRDGEVSYSDDGGETFTQLEDVYDGDSKVTVAFDTYFDTNMVIYAAVEAWGGDPYKHGGIYRWVIDESEDWQDLKAEPMENQVLPKSMWTSTEGDDPVEVAFTGLVVDRPGNPYTSPENGGVIYASYYGSFALNETDSYCFTGVARSLERMVTVCTTCLAWDFLQVGLNPDDCETGCPYPEGFEAAPDALKICGCLTPDSNSHLFAIDAWWPYDFCDNDFGSVWTYEDCYAKKAPEITSPAEGFVVPADPCSCYSVPFTVLWDPLCDACSYDIAFAMDEEFTMPVKVNGEDEVAYHVIGDVPSYSIMGGQAGGLSCEMTYYVRVRAADAATGEIIHSWWSDPVEFMIAPSQAAGEIDLVSPEPGATGVAVEGVGFSWNLLAEADAFDWWIDDNSDFSSPVEQVTGLTSTAYQSTETLDYDTTYYWQVIAYNEGAAISSSAVGTFRTMEEAEEPPPVEEPATPFWVWVVIAIGAVLVIVVIVLIFRTRRV